MKTFILALVICLLFSFNKSIETVDCLEMDILLVGDFSGSIRGREGFITEAFDIFVNRFELSEQGIKIGVMAFESDAHLICPLTSDRELLTSRLNQLKGKGGNGGTNTSDALVMATNELIGNGRQGYRKMIVLVSDGIASSPDRAIMLAKQIKYSNINICGVLIDGASNSTDFMKEVSSDFCYFESDFNNLINTLKKLNICL